MVKWQLDALIEKYKVQPVGSGYIDCIVALENVFYLIDDLSVLRIRVSGLTWWCHFIDKDAGCPHGMGGPKSVYYEGWFSEMDLPLIEFETNEQATAYITAPDDPTVLKCFVPGLWLDVPDEWSNKRG